MSADQQLESQVAGLKLKYGHSERYSWPGPLPCGDHSEDYSIPVDAKQLGYGRFFNYQVLCAGVTVWIFFDKFEVVA